MTVKEKLHFVLTKPRSVRLNIIHGILVGEKFELFDRFEVIGTILI